MKRTLFKYLITELLIYFLVAFLFFFLIFFVNQILLMAEDILKKRVPVVQVITLITYSLPFIIAQSAPFATLVGFLMCLGRMVSDNELLVLRSLGISFPTILVPALVLGLFISIASFFVNDYLLPTGTIAYNKLYREILLANPGIEIESNSIKRTHDSVLIIGDVSGNTVSDLVYFDLDGDSNQRIIVSETTSIIASKDPAVLMTLKMDAAKVFLTSLNNRNNIDFLDTENTQLTVFSSMFFPDLSSGQNPREMTSFDLAHTIHDMRQDEQTDPSLLNIYELEFNKKYSLPFGSFFFALLAVPLALLFGKNRGQTIGMIIGVVVCVLYWAMLILGQTFGFRNGLSGFWTMWFPNIVVTACAVFFYLRLVRK